MIRYTRLTSVFAFGAALTAAGAAFAQTQAGSAAQPAPAAQTAPAPAQPPWDQPAPAPIKPLDPNSNQPTYSVDPPPDGASGVYLPAAVLGYAKSAAGCVVVGCVDGPQGSGAAATPPPPVPPPANPGPPDPR